MPVPKLAFPLFFITCWSLSSQLNGQLQYPIDVAVSGDDLIVVDRNLPGIFRVASDGALSEVFKASKKFRTPLNAVRCVAVSADGDLFFGDSSTRQIYKFEGAKPIPILTNRVGIGVPYAMVFDKGGNLFVSDLEAPGRIYKIPAGETEPQQFAIQPAVRGLAIDQDGNLIALTGLKEAVLKFTPDGKRSVLIDNRPFEFPNSLLIKGDAMYVSDSYKKCVWKIGSDLKPVAWCVEGISYPGGMAIGESDVLVTDSKAKKVFRISPEGKAVEVEIK